MADMAGCGRMLSLAFAATLAWRAAPALAQIGLQSADSDEPVLFTADSLEYDDTLGIVTARGNVELSRTERTLIADVVAYNERTDIVTAYGDVALLEPSGEVLFSDYAELTGDLKDALVSNIGVLLTDNARFAANVGRRTGGDRTELAQAVYSPCAVCAEHPNEPPLWRIKAERVVYDQAEQEVRYRNARLEFFGFPVAYTPYFSHPGPEVDRKTGFLAPSIGGDSFLGQFVRVPYFVVIDDQSDVTVTPVFTTQQGAALFAEYRQRFSFGELSVSGSITRADREESGGVVRENRWRGHFDAFGVYNIDENWRAGHMLRYATDDTYRRLYGVDAQAILRSNAFVEGFFGSDYAAANFYNFKDQREDESSGDPPLVLPDAVYSLVGDRGAFGSYWTFDANARSLYRHGDGADSQRVSLLGGWRLPYVAPAGDIYDLALTAQGDLYYVNDFTDPGSGERVNGAWTGRLFPQLTFQWRYPLVRQVGDYQQIIEPIFGVALAPNGGNPEDIPNEDSRSFELDDTNIFAASRFPGRDRVEGGQRLNYGVNLGLYGPEGDHFSLFLGQSYRPRDDDAFAFGSGLANDFSDVVGRIEIAPLANFRLADRFRYDVQNGEVMRHEVALNAGPPVLNLDARYAMLRQTDVTGGLDNREQLAFQLSSQIDPRWRLATSLVYDLNEGDTRFAGVTMTYEDECFVVDTSYSRSFFQDRDLEQSDTFTVRIALKTLGEIDL